MPPSLSEKYDLALKLALNQISALGNPTIYPQEAKLGFSVHSIKAFIYQLDVIFSTQFISPFGSLAQSGLNPMKPNKIRVL
jgi:hypothetical protein